jgi:tetratricopeptide (TPR) repeat protein
MTAGMGGRRRMVSAVLAAAAVALAFSPVVWNGFVDLDDPVYILENRHVRAGLSGAGVAWAVTSIDAANWHPLTWLSHMADVSLFGLDPRGHHLVSVTLHAATAALLAVAWSGLVGSLQAGLIGSLIFALHPLRVESVAWASQRKDVLALFFGVLALLAWIRHLRRRGTADLWLAVVWHACAVAAKPTLVVLPLLLLLLDWWPLGRVGQPGRAGGDGRIARLAAEKSPFLLASVASGVLTFVAQSRGGAVAPIDRLAIADRVAVAVSAAAGYLGKMVAPVRLAVFYPHPAGDAWGARAWVSTGVLLLLAALAWRLGSVRPALRFGPAWFLIALLPVSGLVQVGAQGMADRYTMLPMVGLALAAGWLVAPAPVAEGRMRGGVAVAIAGIGVLACLTAAQSLVWRDTHSLYRHALRVTRENWFIEYNLGARLEREGSLDQAEAHFRRALAIKPVFGDARRGLGNVALARGSFREASERYREALERNPGDALAAFNLGVAEERLGETTAAAAAYRHAIAADPSLPEPRNNLGVLLLRFFRVSEAYEQFRLALAIDPGYVDARENAGLALERMGNAPAAIEQYREALRLDPGRRVAGEGLRRLGSPPEVGGRR